MPSVQSRRVAIRGKPDNRRAPGRRRGCGRSLGHRVGGWVIHVPAVVCTNSPTVGMNLGLITLQTQRVGEGSLAMYVKKIAAGAAMVGALGFTAVGLGAGTANAAPPAPVVTGVLWQQDRGHGGDWGHGDGQ